MSNHRLLAHLLLFVVCTLATEAAEPNSSTDPQQQWCTETRVRVESQQQCKAAAQACQECISNTTTQPERADIFLKHTGPKALVTVLDLSDPEGSVTGATALAKSALRHAAGYFQSMELLVPEHAAVSSAVMQRARLAGWRVRLVRTPSQQPTGNNADSWQLQLHVWSMTEFQEVVVMDPSAVFVQPLLASFTSPGERESAGCKVWAPRMYSNNGAQSDSIDSSVLVVHPDVNEHARLQRLFTQLQPNVDEHTFFRLAFRSSSGGGSLCCRLVDGQGVRADRYNTSNKQQQQVQILHFAGLSVKPWTQQKCSMGLEAACSKWRRENTSDTWPVTVVTAYYTGPSKHGAEKYEAWGQHFMSQRVPMVVISDNISAVPSIELRDPRLTLTLQVSMGDFAVSQPAYEQHWEQQHGINPERSIHSVFLYKVWAEKTAHVMRAIAANPFNSSHYVWVDYGAFRDPAVWQQGSWSVQAERFPTRDRLLMLKAPYLHPTKLVGGGIFGGTVRAWQVWAELFYSTLSRQLHNGTRFLGDDQIMMSVVWAEHPAQVCVLKHTWHTWTGRDPWFYLQDYLAGVVPADSRCGAGSRQPTPDGANNIPESFDRTFTALSSPDEWCPHLGVFRESLQQYEAAVQAYQECSRNSTSGPVAAWSMYRAFNVLFYQLKDNQRALAACTAGWDAHNAPELAWCAGFVSVYLQQHSEAKEWAERAIALGCFNGSCQPLEALVPAHLKLAVQSCSWEGPWDVLVWANKGLGDTAREKEASQLYTKAHQARQQGQKQPAPAFEAAQGNFNPEGECCPGAVIISHMPAQAVCRFRRPRTHLINQPAALPESFGTSCLAMAIDDSGTQPVYGVLLNVWNSAHRLRVVLAQLLKHTQQPWELIISFDGCEDDSYQVAVDLLERMHSWPQCPYTAKDIDTGRVWVSRTNLTSSQGDIGRECWLQPSSLVAVRLIKTTGAGLFETASNNIMMLASRADIYILVQDDQFMTVSGWNVKAAYPIHTWPDVISASMRCAHGFPQSGVLHGPKCTDTLAQQNGSTNGRCRFFEADSGNRGPLLLRADYVQQLGYLDELHHMGHITLNDDHDLHYRAYHQKGWVSGHIPVDYTEDRWRPPHNSVSAQVTRDYVAWFNARRAMSPNADNRWTKASNTHNKQRLISDPSWHPDCATA